MCLVGANPDLFVGGRVGIVIVIVIMTRFVNEGRWL